MMETLWHDIRYGARVLAKKPGFTVTAVATLVLGICANTSMFSVVYSVLLRPLPIQEPERMVVVNAGVSSDISAGTFVDWRERNSVFQDIAAVHPEDVTLTGIDEPERIRAWVVSPNFFELVGGTASFGRTFASGEDTPLDERSVVLAWAFWKTRFGGDPSVFGTVLKLNGVLHTVLGVMPSEFGFSGSRFGRLPDLWVRAPRGVPMPPIDVEGDHTRSREIQYMIALARLPPGVTREQAQAEMDLLAQSLAEQYPDTDEPREVQLTPLREQLVGETGPALWILLGAVSFVLLIACANVASLMWVRVRGREKEIAIRSTLGASRYRLVRQHLIESLLLSAMAGAVGLLLSVWSVDLVLAVGPENIPGLDGVRMDGGVIAYTALVTLVTAMGFGLAPALQGSRLDIQGALKEGGAASGGPQRGRLRGLFVAVEVAVTLVLLIGAALMLRSLLHLHQVDPGFQKDNVLTLRLWLPQLGYSEPGKVATFYEHVVERARDLPGVRSSCATLFAPGDGGRAWMRIQIEGQPESNPDKRPAAGIRVVTPDYFRTVGIPLRQGRDLTDRDDADAPPVALINEAMARRFWPADSPIGKRFAGDEEQWIDIVGVVGDVRHEGPASEPKPEIFVPHKQLPIRFMTLAVHTEGDPLDWVGAVRSQVQAVDPDIPVYGVRTLEEIVSDSVSRPRFHSVLLGAFAGLALALSVVGIYGLVSFWVTQRTREMGIRVALGARSRDVIESVLRQGLTATLVGLASGLVLAFALMRALARFLPEMSPSDPWTFVAVTVVFVLVAAAASYVPARRATRVDPLEALRYE